MPKLRIFLAVGVALSAASLSACTSTGNGVSPDLALNSAVPVVEDEESADFPLPETVAVLPTAYAPVEGAPVPLVAEATEAPADATALVAEAALPEGTLPPPSRPGDPIAIAQPQPATVQVASLAPVALPSAYATPEAGASSGNVDQLIAKYAAIYEVPVDLVRHVVKRESNFYPGAYNKGHWGLMQIKHSTARGLGYDGPPNGLLDAETNLKYAVKYLRGALLVADGDYARADNLYRRGYYYDAKRKGLLSETGMGADRHRMRSKEEVAELAQPQVEFPPVAEVIPASVQGEFPPAPAAPDATPVPTALGATPVAAPSADMPVITPATAPVPTAAPAGAATAGA